MTSLRKMSGLAILLVIVVASLLIFTVQAAGRQNIHDLNAPRTASAGTRFAVTIKVQYDFTGEGDVEIWARVRRYFGGPLPGGDVARAVEDTITVRGKGDLAWSFQIDSSGSAGNLTLEAYAFHWEDRMTRPREVIDDTKQFSVLIIGTVPTTTVVTSATTVSSSIAPQTQDQSTTQTTGTPNGILGIIQQNYPLVGILVLLLILAAAIFLRRTKPAYSQFPQQPQPASVTRVSEQLVFCVECGTKNSSTYRFCGKCGQKLVHS